MRDGDQQALVLGAGLFAYAWLRLNKDPEKTLLFRKTVPEGSGIVIRSGKPGELPFIDITKL